MNPISFGRRSCGDGQPVYLALEIGATLTSLESALMLLTAAHDAGADALKVQILDPERLVGDPTLTVTYGTVQGSRTEPMRDILRRRALSPDEWKELAHTTLSLGLDFVATVDFPSTLQLAVDIGATALKVCSGDVTHLPWVREVARAGRPFMLDTGNATIGEVERAVDAAFAHNNQIVLHHCPSGYPAHLESINLRVITTMRQMFPDFPIAFSDHSGGRDMDVAAVALGVSMIEKTLTLDRTQEGPEHIFSLEPQEAEGFVEAIRAVEVALGRPRRVLSEAEHRAKQNGRRSLYTAGPVQAGDTGPVEWRRPGGGIEPTEIDYVMGRAFARDLPGGQRVRREDLR